jgi:hypothetical protein
MTNEEKVEAIKQLSKDRAECYYMYYDESREEFINRCEYLDELLLKTIKHILDK